MQHARKELPTHAENLSQSRVKGQPDDARTATGASESFSRPWKKEPSQGRSVSDDRARLLWVRQRQSKLASERFRSEPHQPSLHQTDTEKQERQKT